ncbi:MAG: ATP-binding protein [Helicobacteraceae bacterium]|jgi:two-component system sensor histidine kinase/response regulator|nr:ATP-binding protein [Helicobacteraceae bacterium]
MSRTSEFAIVFLLTLSPLLGDEALVAQENSLLLSSCGAILFLVIILLFIIRRNKKQNKAFKEAIETVQEEAVEAERAKDTFLANVSHETRTPMNAIIGLSHILLQSNLNHSQKTNITKIKRSAEHLLAITNDILDYSKIEAGKLEINDTHFECSEFFGNLADMMGINAVDKKLDLIFDISEEVPDVLIGDPLRISQILINLLNNAIKFTDKGNVILRVSITEHKENTYNVKFEVKDTGIGLSEEQISKLFHAFDQADNKINRKYGGTGLGLAISKELVQKMSGELKVKSTFREGSTFYFTLPLKISETASKAENRHIKRLLMNKSILIVEKNHYAAQLLTTILSHNLALPKIIHTVEEMNTQLTWMHYDAILIDSRFLPSITDKKQLSARSDALVLLKYEVLTDPTEHNIRFDSTITKPFSYYSVLSSMSDIFAKNITVNAVKQTQTTFDDILVLRGSKILLAEDNEGNQMVVEGLLEGSGIELTTVINGQKAVEAVFNRPDEFELILMDINMPVMDGYAATSIIREYQKYDNIPIVAMTANITEIDIEKSKSFGMQEHLSKPINVENFYKVLLQFIKPKVAREEVQVSKEEPSEKQNPVSIGTLPGLDTEGGLSRVNGNIKAYQNILFKFADLFENITQEFRAQIDSGAFDEGRALAHNLKGLSGNVGANDIFELAKELEDAFKDHTGEFTPLIDAIDTKLKPLIQAIRSLKVVGTDQPEVTKEPISTKVMRTLLSELYINAKKKKAREVKNICKEIKGYAWPSAHQKTINAMLVAAEGYKFDHVRKEIESIIPEIKNRPEG